MDELLEIFKKHDCRLENECGEEWVLSIINRSQFPRLWIDNNIDNSETIISESVEHLLARNNPILTKDWLVRFRADNLAEIIEQYKEWRIKP